MSSFPFPKLLTILSFIDLDPIYKPQFESKGFYEWKLTVARKQLVVNVRPEDLEDFAAFDTSLVWDKFPKDAHALTIHGMKDAVVPPYAFGTTLSMRIVLTA